MNTTEQTRPWPYDGAEGRARLTGNLGTAGPAAMNAIRTEGGEITGTFRVYEGDVLIGYVLTKAKPGDGPHWTRPLGYQGRTVNGTVAEWGETKDEAMGALLVAYRADVAAAGTI